VRVRTYFLICSALVYLHAPIRASLLIIVGYSICSQIDRWLSRRAKDRVFDEEMFLWKDPEDPRSEVSGGLSRVRLEAEHQRIVTRLAEFIRRID
jgi:hypothetical protein